MLLRMGDRPRGPAVRAGEVRRQRPQPGARRAGVPAAGQGVQGPRRRPRRPAPHGRVRASGDPRGQGAHLPAELQVAALQAGLPRGGHHLRLRHPSGQQGGEREGLHGGGGGAQARVPAGVLHRGRREPVPALPGRPPAPQRAAQRVPPARDPQGPQPRHRGPRRPPLLQGHRGADQEGLRGGRAGGSAGRRPGPARELRGLPLRRDRRGGARRAGSEVRPPGGHPLRAEDALAQLPPGHPHTRAGDRHHQRLDLPDLRQQGAHGERLPQGHGGPLRQACGLVLVHLRLDGTGRLRADHGGQQHDGRGLAVPEVDGLPEHRGLRGVGRHRRDRAAADDLRLQGRLCAVRPGPEAHRPC
mmetsp:Transcript_63042/g.199119  ORF Transcript_63042/g.199119 Transcript_63042/m.199119 type:complete len:358 (-) Transcript_63042:278-1351(-)